MPTWDIAKPCKGGTPTTAPPRWSSREQDPTFPRPPPACLPAFSDFLNPSHRANPGSSASLRPAQGSELYCCYHQAAKIGLPTTTSKRPEFYPKQLQLPPARPYNTTTPVKPIIASARVEDSPAAWPLPQNSLSPVSPTPALVPHMLHLLVQHCHYTWMPSNSKHWWQR